MDGQFEDTVALSDLQHGSQGLCLYSCSFEFLKNINYCCFLKKTQKTGDHGSGTQKTNKQIKE